MKDLLDLPVVFLALLTAATCFADIELVAP